MMDYNDDERVRDRYTPDQHRSLSDAVLEAIAEYKGEGAVTADIVLYEDIDPDALDDLFKPGARSRTTVQFTTGDVLVELWGDDGVEIRVGKQPSDLP